MIKNIKIHNIIDIIWFSNSMEPNKCILFSRIEPKLYLGFHFFWNQHQNQILKKKKKKKKKKKTKIGDYL